MIELAGLAKSYGAVRALEALDLTLRPGEVAGLLGPNGAGKTTAMRLMAGVLAPSKGTIRLFGHPAPAENPAARAYTGYLPEGFAQPPELTVQHLLLFAARARGMSRPRKAAAKAAALTGLAQKIHSRAGSLSKGYRCRLGLAAAIIHDPPVLLLDEPADGLDPVQRQSVYRLIRQWKAAGKLLVLSTHNLAEAKELCDRFIMIAGGKIRADAPAAELQVAELQHLFEQWVEPEH